jgi:hypothetical protein
MGTEPPRPRSYSWYAFAASRAEARTSSERTSPAWSFSASAGVVDCGVFQAKSFTGPRFVLTNWPATSGVSLGSYE